MTSNIFLENIFFIPAPLV